MPKVSSKFLITENPIKLNKQNSFIEFNSDLLKMWASIVNNKKINKKNKKNNFKSKNQLLVEQRINNASEKINLINRQLREIDENVRKSIKIKMSADRIEEELYKTLLNPQRYEKDVRPTLHHSIQTNVTFGFLLNQIVEMDEKNQVLTTRCWLNINWFDPRLSWNQSDWGGIDTLYIPHKKLWKPDIMLINNAVTEYFGSLVSTDIMTTSKGNVTWLFSALFKSVFHLNVKYYPFDDQECELRFGSWSHQQSEIDLKLITNQGDLSFYMNNSEFSLINMHAYKEILHFPTRNNVPWSTIVIKIKIHRRPLFYVFNHVLPCALISSMAVLGFLMPPETGEKINMCITTMLSMGVYLQSITESIPPTSEAVPLIGLYYLASLSIVCLATVVNVITLNIHRFGNTNQGRSIPYWMHKFILVYLAKILFMNIHDPDSVILTKIARCNKSIRKKSVLRDLKKTKILEDRQKYDNENCECLQQEEKKILNKHSFKKKTNMEILDSHVYHSFKNEQTESLKTYPEELTKAYFSVDSLKTTNIDENLINTTLKPKISLFESMIQCNILSNMNFPSESSQEKFFVDSFRRILKKIYWTLEQQEIRSEILDERKKIQWQWHQLASVVDRFLLILFSVATIITLSVFLILPAVLDNFVILSLLFK
uniref:Neurotransmitter-gated ion-channel ligand-binding domain-containing protein n=1 Tax=Strongyloides stercoralis TaxID=6248 RepID=A0A0K0EI08_STRER